MGPFACLLVGLASGAMVLGMTGESRAAEGEDTPREAKRHDGGVRGAVAFEPYFRLWSREGGEVAQGLSADFLLLVAVHERWNLYGGAGLGVFNVRARAGVGLAPWGRTRLFVPTLTLGVRAMAGVLYAQGPASESPPSSPGSTPNWSYSGVLGEAGFGFRIPTRRTYPDVVLAPTFLAGPVHYSTGQTFGRSWSARDWAYGGTVAIQLEW